MQSNTSPLFLNPKWIFITILSLSSHSITFAQTPITTEIRISIPLISIEGKDQSIPPIIIPPCKYNKQFALSFTGDDALMGIYQRAFNYIHQRYVDDDPIFHEKAETPTTGFTPTRKLVYTDGCGNDIPFRLGVNWITSKEGSDLHRDGNTYTPQMWWSEGERFTDYYNGILNHGGGDQSKPKESILKNQEEIKNHFGITPFIHGVPGGTTGFPEAAVAIDDIYCLQSSPFSNKNPKLSDIHGSINKFRMSRNNTDTKPLQDIITTIDKHANSSHWLNLFCHNIQNSQTPVNGMINSDVCFGMLDYIYDTYGKGGTDAVWFASDPEIYEYLYTRLNSTVTTTIHNDSLVITIQAATLPHFYFNDLTLEVLPVEGLDWSAISFPDNVTAYSHCTSEASTLINVSFSTHRVAIAEKYTARYEAAPSEALREEALYFISMLKPDIHKTFTDRIDKATNTSNPILAKKQWYSYQPHNAQLLFHSESESTFSVCLYTMNGMEIKRWNNLENGSATNVDEIPSGCYCLSKVSKEGRKTKVWLK